jgi:hypothetical protein
MQKALVQMNLQLTEVLTDPCQGRFDRLASHGRFLLSKSAAQLTTPTST